ncbi:MAG TPA: aldo/keto reductase [Dermatophilaceae bacterium]|mgnify:CR=1 FL=1|nr:aldo/keto reductase [Dermatophilaceae bacterium]
MTDSRVTPVPDVPLRAGAGGSITVPQLGFGVWQVPDESVDEAVAVALDAGYRHIDTARIYGNEAGVGRALRASGMPRGDVFVTTKVWNDDQRRVRAAFDASMERLGLDQLDLFLIHWPVPKADAYVGAWRELLALRDEGRVRAVGVCNFHVPHLQRLLDETGELPAINQVELHPYLQQRELRGFHAEHGVVTESWSPLASGKQVLDDPVVSAVAAKHGVTPAQAIIAWHLALGCVVIPKSVTPSRIRENLAAAQVTLDAEDLQAIAGLDRGMRTGPDPDRFSMDAPD